MSFLGALPEGKKRALREWAWPCVSAAQWQNLWEQLWDESSPPPNLLSLSPWVRHADSPPFSLNTPLGGSEGTLPLYPQKHPVPVDPPGTRGHSELDGDQHVGETVGLGR